jgi:hypothetical protein
MLSRLYITQIPSAMTAAIVPPFGLLRLASPQDIMRIGIVAVSGFRYSPIFDWNRPYHEDFPADTLLYYRQKLWNAIKAPECIVLVAVDKYDPEEAKKSTAAIPPNNGAAAALEGEDVVVGVGCWRLAPGSHRIGLFQNGTGRYYILSLSNVYCALTSPYIGSYPDLPGNQNRDMDITHVTCLGEKAVVAQKK